MKLHAIAGDITGLAVDAIVNAANCRLNGGGGVDGAIHRAAGRGLLEECLQIGGCPTGEAVITSAYNRPCRHVIHTPGPVWRGGGHQEAELLAACYRNSLARAAEKHCRTVAFPCISTGVFRFPPERAAEIAVKTVKAFLDHSETSLKRVIFNVFKDSDWEIYSNILKING